MKEIKSFFSELNGSNLVSNSKQSSLITPFFYPMSGLDLQVLNNDYSSPVIFCDYDMDNLLNQNFIENELGLMGIKINEIELLNESSFEYLNDEYSKMDKSAGFSEWGFADQVAQKELSTIKKYQLTKKDGNNLFLILIQGESACVARLLQKFELNLNLLIKIPGGGFNGDGATEFIETYNRISEYTPNYVIGWNGEGGFNDLRGYIKFQESSTFNYYAKSNELIKQFEVTIRAKSILDRFL
jgi:hypothetical protein